MRRRNFWKWASGGFALAIASVPAWLDYLKISPDSWVNSIKNFLNIKFCLPLPILTGAIVFLCLVFWLLAEKISGQPRQKGTNKISKPDKAELKSDDKFFEKTYILHGVRFMIYTYDGKSALRYQENVYDKAVCATHALELREVRSYDLEGKACPFHGCIVRLGWQPYNQALNEAKSKFLLELGKR